MTYARNPAEVRRATPGGETADSSERADESALDRDRNRLSPVARTELLQDGLYVRLHRALAHEQRFGDLEVRLTLGHAAQYFFLPRCKSFGGDVVGKLRGDLRRDLLSTRMHGTDSVGEPG